MQTIQLRITDINYVLRYITIEIISQYYCFCCISNQTKAASVSRRDFFQKHEQSLTDPKLLCERFIQSHKAQDIYFMSV